MISYLIALKRFFLFFYGLFEAWFLMKFVYINYSQVLLDQKMAEWAFKFTTRMGVKIQLNDFEKATQKTGLIVSNHISWFDPIILRAVLSTRYIAKKEVREYPLIGYIGEKVKVIFISRENKRESPQRVQQVAEILKQGENVAFYPEGTSTEGLSILPFKVTFFEAAIQANVPVIPLILRYINPDGSINTNLGFPVGVSLITSAWRTARQRGVTLEITALDPIASENLDRVELATVARTRMVERFEQLNESRLSDSP